jgi:DNA-binding GntR family transcriptional regulator
MQTIESPQPLRDRVREKLSREIVFGRLSPGHRLGLTSLAQNLGVSETPVREALTQLERQGFLRLSPNRGFFVAPLTLKEAGEIYSLIWTLETLAVRLQGKVNENQCGRLRKLNEKLLAVRKYPRKALEADKSWHECLVANCKNHILLDTLSSIRERAIRYEYAYMNEKELIPHSVDQHDRITQVVQQGEIKEVTMLLEQHWRGSLEYLAEWLSATDR